MFTFKVHFSTWQARRGRRVRSTPFFLQAESFSGAHRIADSILTGMKNADPANEYSIQSIEQEGVGGVHADYSGPGCFSVEEKQEESAS